jgi:hypothetical protein
MQTGSRSLVVVCAGVFLFCLAHEKNSIQTAYINGLSNVTFNFSEIFKRISFRPIVVDLPILKDDLSNYDKLSQNKKFSNISLSTNVPPKALASDFSVKTFSSNFDSNSLNLKSTKKAGKWYPWRFFGYKPSETSLIRINGDASVTLLGDKKSYNANLATATPGNNPGSFLGKAFGGGGYFEASFKFNSNSLLNKYGCPAFWAVSLEHLVPLSSVQWPGMPKGYEHFIEVDFFEYNHRNEGQYTGVMHDWYGTNKTCSNFYCHATFLYSSLIRRVPLNTDFTKYHKYGFLWVVATDSKPGYAEYYFDGKKVGERTSWSKYTNQPPPPGSQSWTFGVIDKHHLVLILGTGLNQPITIRSVDVWQASDAQNITRTVESK